jgi:hypothetical protein
VCWFENVLGGRHGGEGRIGGNKESGEGWGFFCGRMAGYRRGAGKGGIMIILCVLLEVFI